MSKKESRTWKAHEYDEAAVYVQSLLLNSEDRMAGGTLNEQIQLLLKQAWQIRTTSALIKGQ